ncbi:hypothetical protein ANN_06228 [Periplaneta americana]|uniref:Uncharacterized protein n=1 Tax=Periplaneta americana TaxID=6978 RepID=A0ABQ8TEK3_PERAM|nr:hypothetical protein ANN_06228 [Periplaneta americana]
MGAVTENPVSKTSYNSWGDHRAYHTIPPFWLDDRPSLLRHVDVRSFMGYSATDLLYFFMRFPVNGMLSVGSYEIQNHWSLLFFAEKTVTANTYLDMLQLYAAPQLPDGAIFQQDGTPPHFTNMVRTFLERTIPARWIGRRSPYIIAWPARSPDLTPPDFFVGIYLDFTALLLTAFTYLVIEQQMTESSRLHLHCEMAKPLSMCKITPAILTANTSHFLLAPSRDPLITFQSPSHKAIRLSLPLYPLPVYLLGRDSTPIGPYLSPPRRAYIHTSKQTVTPLLLFGNRSLRELHLIYKQESHLAKQRETTTNIHAAVAAILNGNGYPEI